MKTLMPRQESVVKMRFGMDNGREHTLDEVGQSFGVTPEHIARLSYCPAIIILNWWTIHVKVQNRSDRLRRNVSLLKSPVVRRLNGSERQKART